MKQFYTTVNKRPRKAVRFVRDGSWRTVLQSPFPSLPEDYKIYLRKLSSDGFYHARQTCAGRGTIYAHGKTPDEALLNLCWNSKAVDRLLSSLDEDLRGKPAKRRFRLTTVGKIFIALGCGVLIAASIALHKLAYTLLLL